ncbi:MAG: glycosyltransferase family 4 protein [Planctomycetes bacterium]|nr:glycosyltransferase family 4 protein [Planctomycetota bacterium]
MQSRDFDNILVLTPNAFGADGVSTLSRHTLRALAGPMSSAGRLELWSLNECPADAREITPCPVKYRFAAGSKLRFSSWGLRASIRANRRTLVVLMHLGLAPVALPLALRGAKLAVFLLGIESWRPLGVWQRLALSRAHVIAAISEHTIQRFVRANPEYADRDIKICHLGATNLSASTSPAGHGNFALIVGRMSSQERYKGHDQLLQIWPDVLREIPTATLLIAGDGDDRPRLEAKAATLGLGGGVQFLGRVPNERLAALYRDCAFFVMPSRDEGFGLVFLEAMQAGKACIGGAGAAAEIIADGRTGFVIDPADRQQLSTAVRRLFLDSSLRDSMGHAGKQVVAERFTEEHFHRRFRDLVGLPQNGCG